MGPLVKNLLEMTDYEILSQLKPKNYALVKTRYKVDKQFIKHYKIRALTQNTLFFISPDEFVKSQEIIFK